MLKKLTAWIALVTITVQPVVVDAETILLATKSGAYLIDTVKGTATTFKVDKVIVADRYPTDPTNPNPVPDNPSSELAKSIRKNLPSNDNDHAVARAQLYDALADALLDGSLAVEDVGDSVRVGLRALNSPLRPKTRSKLPKGSWKATEKQVSDAVSKAVAAKGLSAKVIADVYKQVAIGHNVTSSIESIDIAAIIAIVMQVIQLLRDLGIIGGARK